MEIIYLLIPLSLVFLAVAVYVFFWAIKHEQFEDMEGPAQRILLDDAKDRRRVQQHATPTTERSSSSES